MSAVEHAAKLEAICRDLVDQVANAMETLQKLPIQKIDDDFDVIHQRLIIVSSTETELARIYADAIAVVREVEKARAAAKANVEDKQVEVIDRPTFKSPTAAYMSRPEIETKMRSLSVEEIHELRVWERLYKDVTYLQDIVRTYQQEANRARRDIDTRLKILQMKY